MLSVQVPCTCGEFIQGVIDKSEALISCPIDIYSTAIIKEGKQEKKLLEKAKKALEKTCEFHALKRKDIDLISIEVSTPLPYGKGYATSTSEMVAVIVAVSTYFGKSISANDIAKICVEIEPTDSIMFSGLSIFKHLECDLVKQIQLKSKLYVLVLEEKESVNTIDFRKKASFKDNRVDSKSDFYDFVDGLESCNFELMKKAMLKSALLNQEILHKAHLKEILEMSEKYNSIGLNVAHSGSLIGVIFEDENHAIKFEKDFKTKTYYKIYSKTRLAKIISGGWTIIDESGGSNGSNN